MNSSSFINSAVANPAVTVLMPVYNGEKHLSESIESILTQTFSDFEFLIINDGSKDKSREIISSYNDRRIHLIDNIGNIGLARSLNKGLALAKGKFIARQDADDISFPKRLELQLNYMRNKPEVVLLGTQSKFMARTGEMLSIFRWRGNQTDIGIRWQMIFESPFAHTSVMFRKDIVWGILHGYNEDFKISQDYELWSRIVYEYKTANLPQTLVSNRQYDSVTGRYKDNIDLLLQVEAVMLENTKRALRFEDVSDEWPKSWVNVTHNKLIHDNVQTELAYDFLTKFYTKYAKINNSAQAMREVRENFSLKLVQIAVFLAAFEPKKAISVYSSLAKVDLIFALIVFPKFLYLLLFGRTRNRIF